MAYDSDTPPREGDKFTDMLKYFRHEMLYCHAMLSNKGVPMMHDGQQLSVSQRLDLYFRRQEELETERMLKSERPVEIQTHCPGCGVRHIDSGEWATRPHRTHLCLDCGNEWRPAEFPTVGV